MPLDPDDVAELAALADYAHAGAVRALALRERIQLPGQFVPSSKAAAVATSAAKQFAAVELTLRAGLTRGAP